MKEFYTRREVVRRSVELIVGGTGSVAAGAISLEKVADAKNKKISRSAKVAGVLFMLAGVGSVQAGMYQGTLAAVDNLPTDDQGNSRELVGHVSSDHFLAPLPMPIYREKEMEIIEPARVQLPSGLIEENFVGPF